MDGDPLLLVRPISRSRSGGWSAALFIIGAGTAERFAYYGVSVNLISYLTGPLQKSTGTAAAAVNAWSGLSAMLPLLGAFIADSYLGRFGMVAIASLFYILGLGVLTLSAMLPVFHSHKCGDDTDIETCSPSQFQVTFFYISLYLLALAQGGHKPCLHAFGADQFDKNDPNEFASRSSFFNWWTFMTCGGVSAAFLILSYVQDNIGWGLGFGIPCITMGISLVVFLLGTKIYRFYPLEDESPFITIGRTFIIMGRSPHGSYGSHSTTTGHSELYHATHYSSPDKKEGDGYNGILVEEAKGMLRLFPIWATCLIYGIVYPQSSTFFTKQGSTMDRRVGPSLQVPPAALRIFISGIVVAFIPIYDRVLVPLARRFSNLPSGITMLQRIGTGIVISIIAMVVAALTEMKRLATAKDFGIVDLPNAPIPMSLWWLVPQYLLYGISEAFTVVGLQEFFYDQVPDSLRSLGLALYISIFGIGSFISSFLVFAINKATAWIGESWFSDNLNRGHLDYFYWLLSGLSVIEFVIYIYFAQAYAYRRK